MDNKLLVFKKSNEYLDLPGGRVESNESIIEALKREIREESQLTVAIMKCVASWSLEKQKLKIKGLTFPCNYLEGNVVLSNEHTEFFWVNVKEIRKLNYLLLWLIILKTYT